MTDITDRVNSPTPFEIKSEDFEGKIVACIKDFHTQIDTAATEGDAPHNDGGWYFGRADRQGVTWSIQVQGRFLHPHPASSILFGNIFDRPLKLPWGSGAALRFMSYVDPTLTHDLGASTRPWALSPLVATMPYLDMAPAGGEPAFPLGDGEGSASSSSSPQASSSPPSPPASKPPSRAPSRKPSLASLRSLTKPRSRRPSISSLLSSSKAPSRAPTPPNEHSWNYDNATERRAYFASPAAREETVLGPETTITCDFAYGFLSFSPTIALMIPGGLTFDLMRYWDGQPVRFVCCERGSGIVAQKSGAAGTEAVQDASDTQTQTEGEGEGQGQEEQLPWGKVLWSVCIELIDDDSA